MKIVFVSHSYLGPYFVVGSHHLARQLARRGHSVWHISPIPVVQILNQNCDKRRVARFFKGVVDIEPNLKEAVIRPLLPWQITRRLRQFGNLFVKLSDIKSLTQRHPELKEVDILITDEPRLDGIENYIRASSIYYRPTDLYADFKNDKTIEETEAKLLAGCKGLIATSEPVMARMLTLRTEIPNLVLTNGVDDAIASTQAEPPALQAISKPRVIYVGAVDQRLDIAAIRFLAGKFPDVSFVIIGGGTHIEQLQTTGARNIHLLGLIPHAQLGGYLQHGDVGILPTLPGRSNEGRSPMKLYEYGLSGLPVLASHTAELQRRKEGFISLYSTHEEAAERLAALLASPRDRATIAQQCLQHAWPAKATLLENFLTETGSLRI